MSRVFLGIGSGPIQTGIFVSGASQGGFNRIVLADVDKEMVTAVRGAGSVTVNTACVDSVQTDTYDGVEIYNPSDPSDLKLLSKIAAEADAICTALPSTALFDHVAPWLGAAFRSEPERIRYVFAAENSTTAADELSAKVGALPNTHYLDTVIGKMSKVFTSKECDLPPLAPGLGRGHLVEAFNDIYTASAPGIDGLGIEGLYPKVDLYPFEEAKLYGHNTVHYMLAFLLNQRGCRYMDEVAGHPDLLALAEETLINECGAALCRKHVGVDPFFEAHAFAQFARGLVARMTSPVLNDSAERVIRDPARKLGWNDRLVGAIRLCLDQDVNPTHLMRTTAAAGQSCFGEGESAVKTGFIELWKDAPHEQAAALADRILAHLS